MYETFDAERRRSPRPALSPREQEVISLATDGRSNREVARQLEVSLDTVKAHLRRARHKLGAGDRDELIALHRPLARPA